VKDYKQRAARHWRWWAISTTIVLLILIALGWAFLCLVDDVANQMAYLMLIGGTFIVTSFVLGQAVQSILVRSWDVWIGDLGPTQIAVLIEEMKKKREE